MTPKLSVKEDNVFQLSSLRLFPILVLISIILIFLQEIAPTPCPLVCGLEFKNPTSLDVHLKSVHSVTKQQIKQAQRIPMSDKNFLLVIAKDNVMCMTVEGCNLKFSKVSNARRHYLTKHSDQKNQSENKKLPIKSEQSSYQDLTFAPS